MSQSKIKNLIAFIYEDSYQDVFKQLSIIIDKYKKEIIPPDDFSALDSLPLDNTDAVLITYGDQFRGDFAPYIRLLDKFLEDYTDDAIKGVHILPFFPYSSDDGFSIIDYRQVNPDWGSWDDVKEIARKHRLMVDLVLNHCSTKSTWFKAFLDGDLKYRDYFITVEPGADLSSVFRPRALPLVHEFDTSWGKKLVWTTFSRDQVDLNYANPAVLLEMIDIFLFYVKNGAQIIRLDAIAYLWKELGTSCLHHPKTHAVVKLFRAVCEEVCPWVLIITETNVPHKENISYFGEDLDEAQLVYQFALPPLVLDAFIRRDMSYLASWAKTIDTYGGRVSYFNFLASHDGIGVLPARGILPDEYIDNMIEIVKERGGLVSYKSTPQGDVPYELNINYLSAVAEEHLDTATRARKFIASQAILLTLVGMPGIYVHSLLGSQNWREGVEETGMNRTINRQKFVLRELVEELSDPDSLRRLVLDSYLAMLKARTSSSAFDPKGTQNILEAPSSMLAVLRISPDGKDRVLCLISSDNREIEFVFDKSVFGDSEFKVLRELISGDRILPFTEGTDKLSIGVEPYDVLWLVPDNG
ncbi:sugar phosphorylase [Spirochaetia bacterium 38H-sp]|uniref:Sugar phosphorylase n=1 Tax=Rarispira pelagica TaxID=3141764 RepID=A0ABU9UEE2_9SPIR